MRTHIKIFHIISHFDHVIYTDEAHVDPPSIIQEEVLREERHQYDTENIQERGQLTGVLFFVAGQISQHGKAAKLGFYNNQKDYVELPPYLPKPRWRSKTESEDESSARVQE